jgi:predicted ATPase
MTTNPKRQLTFNSDMNNNDIIHHKKTKSLYTIGQIKQLHMLNFMCHKNFSIEFHPTHMQIVTGANGSGKSTIANAICLCLGAQARTTGRTSNVQSFIRKGET